MTPFNPVMLTLARDIRGMTQSELAHKTKLSVPEIVRFERGFAIPTARELRAFDSVLDFPVAFFLQEGERHPPLGCPGCGIEAAIPDEAQGDFYLLSVLSNPDTARDTLTKYMPDDALHELIDLLNEWREADA